MTRQPDGSPSPREAGLRRLAAGRHDRVLTTLQHALQDLHKPPGNGKDSAALRALVDGVPLAMRSSTGAEERAKALWHLIKSELERIESPEERTALRAALHLDPTNREPSIDARLKFAKERDDFGPQRSGRPPGYDALRRWWGDGVRRLGERIDERLGYLRDEPHRWREYLDTAEPRFRKPSRGAQPVFVDCFVTTVFMQGRFVHRRITERLITAQEDGVAFYTARALPENTDETVSVPVRAIWGCRAERLPSSPGKPILTRLHFPVALQRGQRHYFSSEAMAGDLARSDRLAINVEIDHHGIAPGKRLHDAVPISGLTIRVRFDENDVPEACWWYAEVTERERYDRPDPGDDRWLAISPQGMVEHTFAGPCQPLANYGISFGWPDR